MSSNHSSFLKMIGLEGEPTEPDHSKEVESRFESQDIDPNTQTETEWDPDRLVTDQNEVNQESTDQRQSQFSQIRALEDRKTNLSKISMLSRLSRVVSQVTGRVTRTEIVSEQNELPSAEQDFDSGSTERDRIENAQTHIYSIAEENQPETQQTRPYESAIESLVDVQTERIEVSQPSRFTRSQRASTQSSALRTAHFDYDETSGVARFLVLDGKVNSKAFYLGQLPLRIGRDPLNEIVIDDSNVSRYHAEIQDKGGKPCLIDKGSTNGVKVNGAVVQESELKNHDIVQIGDALFEFVDPGVLSKGVLPVAAIQSQSVAKPKGSRTKLLLAIIVIAAAGWYLLRSNSEKISDSLNDRARQIVAAKVETQISDLRDEIEKESSQRVSQMRAEAVKKAFFDKVDKLSIANLISAEIRQKMNAVPAEILKIFVEDPKVLAMVASSGGSADVLFSALRIKLGDFVQAGRYPEALSLVTYLSASQPADEKLKKWKSQLEERVAAEHTSDEDAQTKTEQILKAYESNFDGLIERGKIKDALQFARTVRSNAIASIEKFPQFADRAKAEAEAWAERVKKAEALYADYQRAAAVNEQEGREAEDLYQEINSELDFANIQEARKLMDSYVKKFPRHSKTQEVLRLRKQLEEQLGGAFSATKMSVETLIKAESFENAWSELYRFLDQMPDHSQALELRMTLDKLTAPKATQYYNQARVFEFEADDLVAAEQYYKKTLDVADPRGELFKKAQRRHADVKRKSIR